MRTCVIFNPTAKGDKARRFREHLGNVSARCALKPTTGPGDARQLCSAAISDGFELIVAAGGDGTVNEVLNGFADAHNGFRRARLGVLPLGTVNVFARELLIPRDLGRAWDCLQNGKETSVDLPNVEFQIGTARHKRYFAQLAGAGLDARAIQLVHWPLKKRVGPLAYVIAGLQAIIENAPSIEVKAPDFRERGALVLVGNGTLYGGNYNLFPRADLRDGLLDICLFPRASLLELARCAPGLLVSGKLPEAMVRRHQAKEFELTASRDVPFELDGELCGTTPAKFSIQRDLLRVIVP